eukprot:gene3783-703_t
MLTEIIRLLPLVAAGVPPARSIPGGGHVFPPAPTPSESWAVLGFAAAKGTPIFDVMDYGAKGNAKTDDTAAFRAAAVAAVAAGEATLYIPTGNYLVTGPVNITTGPGSLLGPLAVVGDGWQSNILWQAQGPLFTLSQAQGQPTHLTVADLGVTSVGSDKGPGFAAWSFPSGLTQSRLSGLLCYGRGLVPGVPGTQASAIGTCLDLGAFATTDTVTVEGLLVWFHTGSGVAIGRGSEVRIIGGRIIGDGPNSTAVGVHVTGNNGGVHITTTDVISNHVGVLLNDATGAGSNREIFMTHATVDSNWRGLEVHDGSYVSVAGAWFASSVQDNIWTAPSADGCFINIAGGTIFNAGAIGGNCSPEGTQCNGIVANAGSFSLAGVAVRNNKGRGVWVPGSKAAGFAVTGCKVYANGQAFDLANSGGGFAITGNVVASNDRPADLGALSGGAVVASNVGLKTP